MTQEQPETNKNNIDLYLNAKKDIDQVRKDVEKLLLTDSNLYHKVDKLEDSFKRMETGFGYSRETGHKTWEAVQKMSGELGKALEKLNQHDGDIVRVEKRADKAHDKYDWLIRGSVVVVIVTLIISIIKFGFN